MEVARELIEESSTTEEAKTATGQAFGLSAMQTAAVVDSKFRRVCQADRDRIASELSDLCAEIADLEATQ
jgi:DNA gyrase/topoisomerase IV subunit A